MTSLAFDFGARDLWRHVPVEYAPARELADRHYSRQTVGAKGILPGGWRFLLWHDPGAVWGVCRNRFRGRWRWRNTIFRNESSTLSSDLVIAATRLTYELWLQRYKGLPPERLTSEIDIAATRRRRSRKHPPGYCYLMAGWEHLYDLDPGHGRPARAVWAAPLPSVGYDEGAASSLPEFVGRFARSLPADRVQHVDDLLRPAQKRLGGVG